MNPPTKKERLRALCQLIFFKGSVTQSGVQSLGCRILNKLFDDRSQAF